jgi:hypothetical protein
MTVTPQRILEAFPPPRTHKSRMLARPQSQSPRSCSARYDFRFRFLVLFLSFVLRILFRVAGLTWAYGVPDVHMVLVNIDVCICI